MKKDFDDLFIEWLNPTCRMDDPHADVLNLLRTVKRATSEEAIDEIARHPEVPIEERFAAVMGCAYEVARMALDRLESTKEN